MWLKKMNRSGNIFFCLCATLLLVVGNGRAETVFWSDNFETNAASRWISTGVWHIGSPTAGPAKNSSGYRTHAGANCASTQGYPYSQDARIYCKSYLDGSSSLVVPDASEYPRLRFWHWFSLANALGYVEISTDNGGTWTQISPTYENINGGGVWSCPSIDLSAYAGESVQIAFHFTSGCCVGNALGWFVDDVAVVTNAPVLNNPESFESGPNTNDWAVDAGTWEIGMPASGPKAAHTGTNCAATVLAGNYANNVDSRLISPPFQVPASGNAALSFWQWYSFENALGFVEINNGTTSTIGITNSTITTNVVFSSLNTNIYQLSGAAALGYSTPFYWNQTIGGWTNATKALGNVQDTGDFTYHFEAGNAPLAHVNEVTGDYLGNVAPSPQSAAATNFLAWQGMIWKSVTGGGDNPVGYFGTNYSYTYTTNTTVTFNQISWQSLSPAYISVGGTVVTSGGWTNAIVDLSAYAGQTVQIAFHFTSGGVYAAAGWYVDDITLLAAPDLLVPTNQIIYFGQKLTNTISATNSILPNSKFTFGLAASSTNVVIVKTNGVLTWTNTVAPPGTYVINAKATDNSVPPLSATNSYTVTVLPLPPPTLTVPATQTIALGQTLAVTNISATNTYLPGSTFTFSLVPPSTNCWINTNNGVLNWTNTAASSGSYLISVKVEDNSIPPLMATNSFTIIVAPPPALLVPGTQTNHAGQPLAVTIFATNSFLPGSTFTFSLPSSSTNYWITTNGVLTWTNTGIQNGVLTWTNNSVSPGTKHLYVTVTDNSSPPMSATSNFDLIFLPPLPPILVVPTNQTIYAGQTLVVTNYATNNVLTNCTFTFHAFSPTNVDVSNLPTNGVLTWATTTTQPVGTYTNIITVTDNSLPPLSATNSFWVVILPPPPPELVVPPTQAIYVGETLVVTNYATSSVFPNSTFTYSLAYGPANMDLSNLPKNGVLKWTPTAAQAPSINSIYIKVTDNNSPPLSTIAGFLVLVSPTPSPTLIVPPTQTISATNGFQFTLNTAPNTAWRIDASTDLLNWLPISTNAAGSDGTLQFTDLLATNFPLRFYRAVLQ